MAKEIVYILTNPSLNGWIKIGFTAKDDITQRLNDLNNSEAIPLDFRVYALLYCENAHKTEGIIHNLFDNINPEIHAIEQRANGKLRKKEFFQILPEKAYDVMTNIVDLAPEKYELVRPEATPEEKAIENIVEQVAQKEKRSRTSFEALEIPVGSKLVFYKDENVICTTTGNGNKVLYNGEITSLSAISSKILGQSVSGTETFLYNGETLWDRRNRMESENACAVDAE